MKNALKLNKFTGLPYLPHDVQMRLEGTVIKIGRRPVYISDVETDGNRVTMKYLDLLTHRQHTTILPDRKIDLRGLPLGYVNTEDGAVYVARRPTRRYKQGLSSTNISAINSRGRSVDRRALLLSSSLGRAIQNDYPTMEDALERVQLSPFPMFSCAFHRRWAIEKDEIDVYSIMYRCNRVGVLANNEIHLGRRFNFLKEEVERIAA